MSIPTGLTGLHESIRQSRYRDYIVTLPLIAFFLTLTVLSFVIDDPGTVGEFLSAGGMVAPFVILALLAYLGEKEPVGTVFRHSLASRPPYRHCPYLVPFNPRTGRGALFRP